MFPSLINGIYHQQDLKKKQNQFRFSCHGCKHLFIYYVVLLVFFLLFVNIMRVVYNNFWKTIVHQPITYVQFTVCAQTRLELFFFVWPFAIVVVAAFILCLCVCHNSCLRGAASCRTTKCMLIEKWSVVVFISIILAFDGHKKKTHLQCNENSVLPVFCVAYTKVQRAFDFFHLTGIKFSFRFIGWKAFLICGWAWRLWLWQTYEERETAFIRMFIVVNHDI